MTEEKKQEPTPEELKQYEDALRSHKVYTATEVAKALESAAVEPVYTTVREEKTYVSPAVFRALAAFVRVGPAPKRPGVDPGTVQLVQILLSVLGPLIQALIDAVGNRNRHPAPKSATAPAPEAEEDGGPAAE